MTKITVRLYIYDFLFKLAINDKTNGFFDEKFGITLV